MIPFLAVGASYEELKSEIDEAILRVLSSGTYIGGAEVEAFEAEYAAYVGANHCVGVGNGLDAIELSLRALDIGAGDEVIVPSNTYIATWLAISRCGATPVAIEPDPETHCMNPDNIAALMTKNTKAVLPVHLYGQPAESRRIRAICDQFDLKMIEDAAQAHGAMIGAARVGALGDAIAWSFYPGKNLGAFGDGGAVTTNNEQVARRVARLRNYGSEIKYVNLEKGFNSRLDPMQAAALRVKLPFLDNWNARRHHIAHRYSNALNREFLVLPTETIGTTHAWHIYAVRHAQRDVLQSLLAKRGVGSLIHYPTAPFEQKAYSEFAIHAHKWPIARQLANEVLSLPVGPHMDSESVETVIEVVNQSIIQMANSNVR